MAHELSLGSFLWGGLRDLEGLLLWDEILLENIVMGRLRHEIEVRGILGELFRLDHYMASGLFLLNFPNSSLLFSRALWNILMVRIKMRYATLFPHLN